jgi:hypothetical protein
LAFDCGATNLVPGDTNRFHDIFLHSDNIVTPETTLTNEGAGQSLTGAATDIAGNGKLRLKSASGFNQLMASEFRNTERSLSSRTSASISRMMAAG